MAELIGVFGGTFDPPHLGHLILAGEALHQLGLARILWVLTPQPPHKPEKPITEHIHRLDMLKKAIGSIPRFEVSTIESERPGPHYTVDTIDLLQDRNPTARLILLLGGDSLRDLPTWYKPDELLTAVYALGVMRRPGDEIDLATLEKSLPGLKQKVRFFDTPQLEISSTTIRERVKNGGHFRFYLTEAVYEYIQKYRLYH